MLGTATTPSDYKRLLKTLRMAINGNVTAARIGDFFLPTTSPGVGGGTPRLIQKASEAESLLQNDPS